MSLDQQWLDLGLQALPARRARRIRLFRLLLVTSAALRGRLDRALAPSGITTQQGALLQVIESRSEPPTLSQVAETMNMTHQNVKQIATALERKGFVAIARDPLDRRARRLTVTAKHRRFWSRRNPADFASVERWLSALGDDEVASMLAMLERVYADLKASKPRRRG